MIHTEFPRFIINLENDEVEWLEDFDAQDQKEVETEAENLIQLRNMKNIHFYNLKDKVKYFALIKQETLLDDINQMICDFNLSCNNNDILINYKKPINYKLEEKSKEFINKNLDNYIDNNFYNL